MMKHESNTQYRFYRPRRPGGMGEGLKLDGMSSWFGLIGIAILILVGIAMLAISGTPKLADLSPVYIEVQAPAYRIASNRNIVLIPLTRAKILALDPATFEAADTNELYTLKKGENLIAWLEKEEAEKWNEGVARKDFYKAILLQKEDKTWLVDYASFYKKSRVFNSKGWWLIFFGVLLIPYQLISKPKIPVWAAIVGFIAAILIWNTFG